MRLSKGLYVGGYIGGFLMSAVFFSIAPVPERQVTLAVICQMLGWVCLIGVASLWCHLYYKAWEAIQDGYARTTPAKAVGFLFIPFFMAYWWFQAIWGWAKDYNAYIDRHSIAAPRVSEGLFLAEVISRLCWIIPVVNVIAILVTLILNPIMMAKICNAVNALHLGEEQGEIVPAVQQV
ncbi:MAG: hypothetical protein ACJ73D_07145 [Pyrinomonadaceae bacterium]